MSEKTLQKAVCDYIRLQYPSVIYRSDMGGIRLTMGQAIQVKKIQYSRAYPDLFLAQPVGPYHGMFLELKKPGAKLYLKDGKTLSSDEHIQEQHAILCALRKRGFYAEFSQGLSQSMKMIDDYLNGKS